MKKILCIISISILLFSLSLSVCAAGFKAEVPAEYQGTIELSAAKTPVEVDYCEGIVSNVTIPAVEIDGVYAFPSQMKSPTTELVPRSYTSFSFDDLEGQDFTSDWIIHTINNPGVAKLHVVSCSWMPSSYEIVIGLYNMSTGRIYGVTYSNTIVSNIYITTGNCPAGDYYVIIKNNAASNRIISDGLLSYNLT